MFKIDTANAATSLPTPKPVGDNVDGFFDSGNKDTSTPPTLLTHDILNAIQEEISYVIIQEGITLNKNDRTQLYLAIQNIAAGIASGSFITQLEDDLSPSLGGNLNVAGHAITTATGNIELHAPAGNIYLNAITTTVDSSILKDENTYIIFNSTGMLFEAGILVFSLDLAEFLLGSGSATTISPDLTLAADSDTQLVTQLATKVYIDNVLNSPRQEYYAYITRNMITIGQVVNTQTFPVSFSLTGDDYQIGEIIFFAQTPGMSDGSHTGVLTVEIYGLDGANNSQLFSSQTIAAGEYCPSSITLMVDFKVASSGLNCNRFYVHYDVSESIIAPTAIMTRMTFRKV